MSDLLSFFYMAVIVVVFAIIYHFFIRRLFRSGKTSRKSRLILSGGGWHFITKKQAPRWIKHKFRLDGISLVSGGAVTEECEHAKGSHYEYKLVVVNSGHTHDNALIRRKLKRHRRHH